MLYIQEIWIGFELKFIFFIFLYGEIILSIDPSVQHENIVGKEYSLGPFIIHSGSYLSVLTQQTW